MQNTVIEICVDSVELAQAAERGGADRVELCHDLTCGGITPSEQVMRDTRRHLQLPIHVLIRPRAGDFCYSWEEFELMKHQISMAKCVGMDAIVLGILDHEQVDLSRTAQLVELSRPLPVTFHRAFDLCRNLRSSLEAVVQTGAKRILTSGGKDHVIDALPMLADLVSLARDRITVMPGGGIRLNNLEKILLATGARELHSSLGRSSGLDAVSRFEAQVEDFKSKVVAAGSRLASIKNGPATKKR